MKKPTNFLAFCRGLLVTVAMFVATAAFAQNVTVKGKVVDDAGFPLPGAGVVIEGTTTGTITDIDGNFELAAKAGANLVISSIGYADATVIVPAGGGTVNVTLHEDSEMLNEVVVTALGITREKKTLGYAIQEVKGEELLGSREVNITNALTGKIAGVQITRSSNGPGSSSKIQLRGNNSLTGLNQPLIVIDGVPMDNFIGAANNDFWNPSADMGNGLQDINAEDVESLTVLKGASAAALYGSRAGNGVILITTKKGRESSGVGITVNQSLTGTSLFMRPDHQTEFGQGSLGVLDIMSGSSWGPKIEGQSYTAWDGSTRNLKYYDNVKNYMNTGINSETNVTLSQKYGKTSIYASGTYMNDISQTPGAELRRMNTMLRGTSTFGKNDRWSFDGKVQFINTRAKNRPISGNNGTNTAIQMSMFPTTLDITEFKNPLNEFGDMYWYSTSGNNPYWLAKYNRNEDTRNRFIMTASLKYKFTDWLDAEIRGGSDFYTTETESKVYGGNPNLNSRYAVGESRFFENNFSFLVSAHKDNIFGNWGGAASFGGNLMERESRGLNSSVGQLDIRDLFSLGNGTDRAGTSESYSHRKMNSLYGTAQVNYNGYVFLDATLRNDWTSTLSTANRSYLYPSVSLSWVISDMINKDFGGMPDWFSYAKTRVSWAQVGNDMDPYQLYNEYSTGTDSEGGKTTQSGNTLFNANVRNELISSYEAGVEVRFFDNRLGFDFAWYKSNATNQLINLPMNGLSGYNSKKVNAGNIQNSGIELMINASPVLNKNFKWDMLFNVSHNNNKIIELADGVERYGLGGYDNLQVYAVVGGDYGEIYGTRFLRVEDENSPYYGQLILDDSGLPQGTSTSERIGSQQAKVNLGWTNSFQWKNLSFSFQVDARIGGQIYSGTQMSMQRTGTAAVTVKDGKRDDFVVEGVRATEDGYVANDKTVTMQQYWTAVAGRSGNLGIGEANLYDATNVRLRNVGIAYSLPQKILNRNKVLQSVKIGCSLTNVFMLYSKMGGLDPESVYATSTNATGFEYGSIPTSRSFVFNLSLGF